MPPSLYRHPRRSLAAPLLEWLVNAPRIATWRRRVLSRLPFLQLQSDVVDVVYLTWLVPVERVRSHVPDAVALWQRDGLTPFTILTYQHRHFGPARLGPFASCSPPLCKATGASTCAKRPPARRMAERSCSRTTRSASCCTSWGPGP
jgi:hypothetical protein